MATLRQVQRTSAKPAAKAETKVAAKATTTTTTTVSLRPQVRQKLLTELRAYAEIHREIKVLDAAKKKHTANVRAIREQAGEKAIEIEGFKTTDVPGEQEYFDKDEFVLRGGDLALYNDCLKKKPKKAYEKITIPGDKD